MGTYNEILACLREALAVDNGSRVKLMERLGAQGSRSTFYRVFDEGFLPRPQLLCGWLDTLGVKIVSPEPDAQDGAVAVKLAVPADIPLDPAERPDRGRVWFLERDLDGWPASNYLAVRARRGMPPTIHPGEMMLVDVSDSARAEMSEGDVHLVRLSGEFMLRRLQRAPGAWLLASDTPGMVPVTVADSGKEQFSVLGRVELCVHRV